MLCCVYIPSEMGTDSKIAVFQVPNPSRCLLKLGFAQCVLCVLCIFGDSRGNTSHGSVDFSCSVFNRVDIHLEKCTSNGTRNISYGSPSNHTTFAGAKIHIILFPATTLLSIIMVQWHTDPSKMISYP